MKVRPLRLFVIILLVLAAVFAASPPASAAPRAPKGTIDVQAKSIPAKNRSNIQKAINKGQKTGKTVRLFGQFDLGFCFFCLRITAPVSIVGQADPTGPNPDPRQMTVLTSVGLGPILIAEGEGSPVGVTSIQDVWLRGGGLAAIGVGNHDNDGLVRLARNRVTDLAPFGGFRFGLAGGIEIYLRNLLPGVADELGKLVLRGDFLAEDNYVDTIGVPMVLGIDDNAIATGKNNYDTITYRNNTMISIGESSEVEFNSGGSSIVIEDNTIKSLSFEPGQSFLATRAVGLPGIVRAGHPDGINMKGVDTRSVVIRNNDIETRGRRTGLCIMAWHSETSTVGARSLVIENNRCNMDGQFTGIMVGWSGEDPFFPPGTLDHAVIRDNEISGNARFGIAFPDFVVPIAPGNNLTNTATGNVMLGNDLTGLQTTTAALYFGPSTTNNSFVGAFNGAVLDEGTGNTVVNTGP
jgi:hypothetical protein